MSNQQGRMNFQGGFGNKVFNAYEVLQDAIIAQYPDADVTILVHAGNVSIKCKEYPDYIRYKSVIKGRTSLPIIWTEKKD